MKLFATAILGLVLAGAAVTPAQADSDDLARAVLGIATVAIIAKAIDDRNDRRKDTVPIVGASRLGSAEQSYGHNNRREIDSRAKSYNRHGPKAGRGYKKRALPQACLRVVETGRGDRLAYGARCLDRNYRFASRLPDRCETAVRTNRGVRTVFGARCLRREGWSVARR